MKKAVVFDNSGTLIERYRVVKDVLNGNIFTDINSLDLIDAADSLALVVLQFNTNKLLKLDKDKLISDVIKEYNIDFDVSFSTRQVSKAEVEEILYNEKSSTVSDITDGFDILREKISHMELCNGSALIVDMDLGTVAYTITSAGKFFPKVFETVANPVESRYSLPQETGRVPSTDWQTCLMCLRTMLSEQFPQEENARSYPSCRKADTRS